MKFFSLAVCFVAMATMIGCAKDNEQPADKVVTSTVTVGLESADASKLLDNSGANLTRAFAADEKIAVVYENTSSTMVKAEVTLAAGNITNDGKTATITVAMTNPKTNGTLKLIYPASMAKANGTVNWDALYNNQDGTLGTLSSHFDFSMYEGTLDGTNLPADPVMESQVAICKFTVKRIPLFWPTDITNDITKLTVKNGSDIYSVNTSSLSEIWVAVKPVTSGDITVYAAEGKKLYEKTVTGKTLAANTPYAINLTPTLVPNAVSGLFRVNNDLIYFSEGNLFANVSNGSITGYQFGTNQYTIGETDDVSTNYAGYTGLVGLFGWGNNSNNLNTSDHYAEYGPTGMVNLSGSTDWGSLVSGSWRTPSTDEWQGVFNGHTYGMATVNGVHGIVILPYNTTVASFNTNHSAWTDNPYADAAAWAPMEAAGAVFLPAAGIRDGTNVFGVGYYGLYWSSTANDELNAWSVLFNELNVSPDIYFIRNYGQSVRLVGM